MSSDGKGKPEANGKAPTVDSSKPTAKFDPGQGIRSLKTSSAFRILNFELYAKPNKFTMTVGLIGITLSIGYLIYMNLSYDKSKYYVATAEDGSAILQPKKSRWD